jgi:UDP-N-acetylglucosamine acyltransferase
MGTILLQDLPPYVTAAGNTASPFGINSEGLKRRGFEPKAIAEIKAAYKTIYKAGLALESARQQLLEQQQNVPELTILADFLKSGKRGIIR